MKFKCISRRIIVAFLFLFFLGLVYSPIGQLSFGETGKNRNPNNVDKIEKIAIEGWYKYYFVPLVPILVVSLATLGGAILSHYYWKKRDAFMRKNQFFEEKTKSYLNLCSAFSQFNAYTDLIMRIEKDKRKLNENHEKSMGLSQIESNYQDKRTVAFTKISTGINFGKIFYTSTEVLQKIDSYLELYEKIRKDLIEWGPQAFDEIIVSGKKLTSSMENELKKELQNQIHLSR